MYNILYCYETIEKEVQEQVNVEGKTWKQMDLEQLVEEANSKYITLERTKEGNNASVTTDDGFNARYSEKDKEEGDDSKERHDNGKDHSDSSGDHHSMYNQDGANPQRLNTVNRSITEINQAVTTLNQYVIDEVSKADTTVNQQGGVRNDISGINRQGSLDPTDASGQITPVKNDDKEEKDEEKYSSEKETEGTKEHETNKSISKLSKLLNI